MLNPKPKICYLLFLVIFNFAHAQLINSPWPMFMHDAQHTGRSNIKGPQDPQLAWIFDRRITASPVIGPENVIYVPSYDSLYALNTDGSIKWANDLPGSIQMNSGTNGLAVAQDGTIYFTTACFNTQPCTSSALYALHPDGTLKWKNTQIVHGSYPVIGEDGTIYVNIEYYLYALNPDGSVKWVINHGWSRVSAPAIGKNGDIYMVNQDTLFCYDTNGTLNWTAAKDDDNRDRQISPVVSSEGTIYVCGFFSPKLSAINPDGTKKWDYPIWLITQPNIGPDGTIYFVGKKDRWDEHYMLYALNSDGTLKWQVEDKFTANTVDSSGTIYARVGENQKIYSINPKGAVNWIYNLNRGDKFPLYCSPMLNNNGDLIFVAQQSLGVRSLFALFDVSSNQTPDLSVQSSDISFNLCSRTISSGGKIKITARVYELSRIQSATAEAVFYYNDKTHPIDTVKVYASKGQCGIAQAVWNTLGLQDEDYKVIVEIKNSNPAESNLSNNEAQISYSFLPLIQKRINNSNPGDTVWVDPGTYFENITLGGGVVVKSRYGPDSTIIDGLQRGSVISIGPTEGNTGKIPVVDGFTIANGDAADGGGIHIPLGWSAIITNNIICQNTAIEGGGIYVKWSSASTIIRNNLITDNIGTGQYGIHGIKTSQSECTIINNTIVNNGDREGIGIESRNYPGESPDIRNCILWGNGTDLSLFAEAYYSNVQNAHISQMLTKSISLEPEFTNPLDSDYTLLANSPCINAGDPHTPRDPDGTRADRGAFYYDLSDVIGIIKGVVIDSTSGKPINMAKIILSGSSDEDLTFTDDKGQFEFRVRPGSDYSLSTYKSNFWTNCKNNILVSTGSSAELTIKLKRNPGAPYIYSPRNLKAVIDSFDSTLVHLQWDPPREELLFDDGFFENAYGFIQSGASYLVGPFGPMDKPATLDIIKMAFEGEKGGDSIRVFVLIDTLDSPETVECEYSLYSVISYSGVFQEFDFGQFNIQLKPGWSFYAGVEQLTNSSMYLKFDDDCADTLAYYQYDSDQGVYYSLAGNGVFAVRAIITPITGAEDKLKLLTRENYSSPTAIRIKKNETDKNLGSLTDMARKNLKGQDTNKILFHLDKKNNVKTDSFLGYNIYRSTVSSIALIDSNRITPKLVNVNYYCDSTFIKDGLYYYTVTVVYPKGESFLSNVVCVSVKNTAVFIEKTNNPQSFDLEQNYPNPFNPSTTIQYQLPKDSHVEIHIYNALGKQVETLVNETKRAGYYKVVWKANQRASGMYLVVMKAKDFRKVRKIVFLK